MVAMCLDVENVSYKCSTHKLGFDMTRMFNFPFFSRLFNSRLHNRCNTNPFPSQHSNNYEGCISDTESVYSELELIMHLDAHGLDFQCQEDECDGIDEYSYDDVETIPLSMEALQAFGIGIDTGTKDNAIELPGNDMEESTAQDSYDDDETIPLSMEALQAFGIIDTGTTDNTIELPGNDMEESTAQDSYDDDETIPLSMEALQAFGNIDTGTTDNTIELPGNDMEESTALGMYVSFYINSTN